MDDCNPRSLIRETDVFDAHAALRDYESRFFTRGRPAGSGGGAGALAARSHSREMGRE
jgi:hypothetical protein